MKNLKNILITGALGYVGNMFLERCLKEKNILFDKIIALDIKKPTKAKEGVEYITVDIRSSEIDKIFNNYDVNIVVHLAAILSSADNSNVKLEYDIDVNGTKNLVNASIKKGCDRFIFTSSGAAYGYTPRNVDYFLTEKDELFGNPDFPYGYHKKLAEQYIDQVKNDINTYSTKFYIFRTATILGQNTKNQITDLFLKKKILALNGYKSSFVFIWDQDLIETLLKACFNGNPGTYNVAADGALPVRQIATILNKKILSISPNFLKIVFSILHPLKLSKHGPKAILFVKYRTMLSNKKLKEEFSYTPQKSSLETFNYFIEKNPEYVNKA